jgi:hypothetical protein
MENIFKRNDIVCLKSDPTWIGTTIQDQLRGTVVVRKSGTMIDVPWTASELMLYSDYKAQQQPKETAGYTNYWAVSAAEQDEIKRELQR